MTGVMAPAGGVDDPTAAQRAAADPRGSVWVSANAGSGKTKVLIDRVARLLLTGVQPQRILCLTYTKAAAAEMQNRLFERLGDWAMMEDGRLVAEMETLGAPEIDRSELIRRARTLFARAIETPGGLKIQTIHALCASLLRRFPLEAGVTPAFREMDERDRRELVDDVLETLAKGPRGGVIDGLAPFVGGGLADVALEVAGQRASFAARPGEDEAGRLDRVRREMTAELRADGPAFSDLMRDPDLPTILDALRLAGGAVGKAADRIEEARRSGGEEDAAAALKATFLYAATNAEAPERPKPVPGMRSTGQRRATAPFQDLIDAFAGRVADAADAARAAAALEGTMALHRFAGAFLDAWDAAKLRAGLLDFDDLIRRTDALLSDPSVAAWVLYRMDGGIDHILVDEAQDTAPLQWQVIEKLTEEFTSGEGAVERPRTLFVVGDPKQSIYGFQGAEPGGFQSRADAFEERFAAARLPFSRVSLRHSFRSSPVILDGVDRTLGGAAGIGETAHEAFRTDMPGRIDVWPPLEVSAGEAPEDFSRPVDMLPEDAPELRLAEGIVAAVEDMVRKGEPIVSKGEVRAVRPGDVLILLRKRGPLFEAIIRRLKMRDAALRARGGPGLPIAGADRLRLGEELAVRDLVSLLAFLALEEDDLALAEVLRSPLLGLSEGDLYELAHARRGTLWHALTEAEDRFPAQVAMLRDLRSDTGFLRPFELLERALTRHGGRRRLLARLGLEAEEGIDALLGLALDYETRSVPSLTGFVSWFREDATEIKRDAEAAGSAIRVMTVHGAKGLEAPVVIVPQTDAYRRVTQMEPRTLPTRAGTALRPPSAAAPAILRAVRAAAETAEREEYERLLYVAMTRAESWLIVAGAGERATQEGAWFARVMEMMRADGMGAVPIATPVGDDGLRIERAVGAPLPRPKPEDAAPAPDPWSPPKLPPAPRRSSPVGPSDLGGAKTVPGEVADPAALSRGTWIHRLLEHLPLHPAVDPLEVARDLLLGLSDPPPEAVLPDLVDEALGVLRAPDLAELFGPGSHPEVELIGDIEGLGPVAGAVDRLLIAADEVRIVDYKSNRTLPASPDEVPEGLLRQLGAYAALAADVFPGRRIRTAILWTADATMTEVGRTAREAALARAITEGGAAIDPPPART
ncbi:MAG: double-strand break repair helicase AddA [Hasllibacter sp.]